MDCLELGDEVHDFLYGGDVGSIFFRDLAVEFFFDGHDKLNSVERVGTEVINESGGRDDLVGLNSELGDDDVLDLGLSVGRHGKGSAAREGNRGRGKGRGASNEKGNNSLLEHHGN